MTMKPCLTFVLGGGGARGAFQVGALRALHEAGLRPDLLVGTSIGAVNAAAIALWGFDETGLYGLELAYQKVAASDILDLNMSRLAMQAISGRLSFDSGKRAADFLIATGITPDLFSAKAADEHGHDAGHDAGHADKPAEKAAEPRH